jgi:hypothetical protein
MKSLLNLNFPRWALLNFIVLSIWGVLLRYLQLFDLPFNYQYLLHAHSHFAFAGWMFFAIAFLMARQMAGGELTAGYKKVLLLALVSGYGMLISFSLQGYHAVSICFSTLFVLVTYRFTYLVLCKRAFNTQLNPIAAKLFRASVVCLCVSSLGPFALGPLAALGLKQSPYYTDAVYWYLHFQMNGFMLLGTLGLLASGSSAFRLRHPGWLNVFIGATLPLYALFTLWGRPGTIFWLLAFAGSLLSLVSWLVLVVQLWHHHRGLYFLEKAALLALALKCLFQVLICLPLIGHWAFLNRNLVIGYIHLLTLGIIMPLLIAQLLRTGFIKMGRTVRVGNYVYILLTVVYLSLLFLQPLLALFAVNIPAYQHLLFLLCLSFLPVAVLWLWKIKKAHQAYL